MKFFRYILYMPSNNTLKKSPNSPQIYKNIIDKLNSINPEINLSTFHSMNIFPEIITRLAKIGKIDKDTLNNLLLITYEHYEIIIEDFKNKIINETDLKKLINETDLKKLINETDLKKLINEILLNQIHLKSSPKFQETIQKGGNKRMIEFAHMIVSIISLFFLISTLTWVLLFIINAYIIVLKPIEYSNDGPFELLREKSFISLSLRMFITRFVYLFLHHIRNKLSNMFNKNDSSNQVVRDNYGDYDENNLRDVITDITGYMGDLIEENNIIPLSVGKIKKKKSNSRFKKLTRATMPYHDNIILNPQILDVDLQYPRTNAIQNYRDSNAIPSQYKRQHNIPFSNQVYQVAYTDEQLANRLYDEFGQTYDEIRVHVRNLKKPVTAIPIWGGTKKRVKKNRRNTKKSSTK